MIIMIVFAGVFSSTFDLSKKNRCTSSYAGGSLPSGALTYKHQPYDQRRYPLSNNYTL